jgi:hypothetical protein
MAWSVEYRDRGSNRLLETPVRSVPYPVALAWMYSYKAVNYKLGNLTIVEVTNKYSNGKKK